MKTTQFLRLLFIGFCAQVAVSLRAESNVTFEDSTFDDADWILTTFTFGNGGSVTANNVPSGGQPGTFRRVINIVQSGTPSGASAVYSFHKKRDAVYSPATQGDIGRIDYSEDSILLVGFGSGQGATLALEQNDKIYVSTRQFLTPDFSWTRHAITNLTATDFLHLTSSGFEDAAHPDFSASGTPITFGFLRYNATGVGTSSSGYTIEGGIDNWRVEVKSTPLTSGLVGYWSADGDANDSVGVNHGSLVNGATATTPGKVGQAFEFDGNNSAIRIPSSALNNAFANLTVQAWVFPRKHGNAGVWGHSVISRTEGAGFAVRVRDGYLQTDLRLSGGTALITFGQAQLPINAWSHIAMTYDGSAVRGFLNGQLLESVAASGTVRVSTAELLIGHEPDVQPGLFEPGYGWNGLIDELSIFNRALAAEEIRTLYENGNQGISLPQRSALSGLVARYTMEGEVRDSVNASHPSSVTDVTFAPGVYGQGAKFGPTGGIVIPSNPALENQRFTWEAWVRLDGPGPRTDGASVISKSVNGIFGYAIGWLQASSTFGFQAEDKIVLATEKFPIGGIYHVVLSRDETKFRLYVNGAPQAELSTSNPINYEGEPWMIGDTAPVFRALGFPRSWDGIIDEVSIYNRALSAEEITANYAAITGSSTSTSTGSYTFTTLAGSPGSSGSADGTGSAARFNVPSGLAVDSTGNIYVVDHFNHTVRKITPSGVVTTFAGLAGSSGSADGTGNAARFNLPTGVAVDKSGNVYVTDSFNFTVRKITPAGVVSTLAGSAGSLGRVDGTGSTARFDRVRGIAVDSAGNVYVGDQYNNTVRKITPAGVVTTPAGLAGTPGSADGPGTVARFSDPHDVAVDSSGNIYVLDYGNHNIRKIAPDGVVSTVAGLAGSSGSANGIGTAARFDGPTGLKVDSVGVLYVADYRNSTIRKITPDGVVSTVAGVAGSSGSADGVGTESRFNLPQAIDVDSTGILYVADSDNHTIRKGVPSTSLPTPTCTPPPSGLVAWWDGNGTANDALGQNDGTLQNGATVTVHALGREFRAN